MVSLGFLREELVYEDGVKRFYELTVYGKVLLLDIMKEKKYAELEKFIELLPLSSTLLQKFAKALFMKRRNVLHEEWGMTEEEATEVVETLSRLLRLGRP
jgi:DNA-binding MarR family transcriptional regulator